MKEREQTTDESGSLSSSDRSQLVCYRQLIMSNCFRETLLNYSSLCLSDNPPPSASLNFFRIQYIQKKTNLVDLFVKSTHAPLQCLVPIPITVFHAFGAVSLQRVV